MRPIIQTIAAAALSLVIAACGSGSPTTPSPSASTLATSARPSVASVAPASVAPASTAAQPAASSPASQASVAPSRSPATRVTGTVQTDAAGKVTLADGTSLDITPTTRVTQQQSITAADLKAGMFVAITGKRQPDNTVLASIVSVFPDSLRKVVPGGAASPARRESHDQRLHRSGHRKCVHRHVSGWRGEDHDCPGRANPETGRCDASGCETWREGVGRGSERRRASNLDSIACSVPTAVAPFSVVAAARTWTTAHVRGEPKGRWM